MNDDQEKVIRFPPRAARKPSAKTPPKPPGRTARPNRRHGEPAINWSRAPKAIVLILLFFAVIWLVGGLGGWISQLGIS